MNFISSRYLIGEIFALNLFKTKSQLETFGTFAEILIIIGIIITITLTKILAVTTVQLIIILTFGSFVWDLVSF